MIQQGHAKRTHNDVRHGTLDLFAALNVATGEVIARCKPQHRAQDFVAFLREIEATVEPILDIHVVLDNLAHRRRSSGGCCVRRLRDALTTGGEEAVIAAFESQPALAGSCPPDGATMLHRAAGHALIRVAKWLLDHGADVNRKSQPDVWQREGRTPLECAVWECAGNSEPSASEAMAALLIERGAALTPLSAAALGRWDYLASCALDTLQGKGLLQAAVRGNRPDVLRRLLEMGLDPDERMQIGQHEDQTFSAGGPLLEAVNTGRIGMARLLIEHGADPNARVFASGSHRRGLQRRLAAWARARPGHDRLDGAARRLD